MATEVILPRVDMDMAEGTITAWHAREGETIRQGEPMFDIETSKATMEVEAPATGTVRRITANVGDTVPVGTVIAWIHAPGEAETAPEQDAGETSRPPAEADAGAVAEAVAEATAETVAEHAAASPVALSAHMTGETVAATPENLAGRDAGAVRATPAARRVARENGIALAPLRGTGPLGRIVEADVQAAVRHRTPPCCDRRPAPLNRVWLHKGGATTLVCLHGFGAEANSWRPLFNALRQAGLDRDVGVLSIDLPGHGKSPADAATALDSIVEAVGATLAAEDVERCHLVGHSFGGAIAIALATAPAGAASRVRVSSLALLAPAGLGADCNGAFLRGLTQAADRAALTPWLHELVWRPEVLDEAFIATAAQQLSSAAKRATLADIAERFFPGGRQQIDLRDAIARLTMPVRIVWGLADRIMPATHADGLPGRIAQHRFAEVGHLPHVEALADVAAIVLQQLQLNRRAESAMPADRAAAGNERMEKVER